MAALVRSWQPNNNLAEYVKVLELSLRCYCLIRGFLLYIIMLLYLDKSESRRPDYRCTATVTSLGLELMARDKVNLDIFWLRDETLEDTANLPLPDELAAEIVENLRVALELFEGITEELEE